ncbi:MAG: hypothetical protein ACE5J7_01040 [Candidatus Aenigmatarchaeota archaeon]
MITEAEAREKVDGGWIRAWLAFEALAISEEVTKKSLESLFNKMEADKKVKVYKKDFSEVKKVENPMPGVKEGWSQVINMEMVVKRFDELVNFVIEYGPSSIEILEPKKLITEMGEAQIILNSVAEMIHRFAAAGVGGVVVVHGKSNP